MPNAISRNWKNPDIYKIKILILKNSIEIANILLSQKFFIEGQCSSWKAEKYNFYDAPPPPTLNLPGKGQGRGGRQAAEASTGGGGAS